MEKSMRAVVFDRYGGPEVLHERHVAMPVARAGDVVVRVDATSVNGADLMLRSGKLALATGRRFPKQLGIDFVGTLVEADAAADLDGLSIGDRVWGAVDPRRGPRSLAEWVSTPATQIARAPSNLTAEEAVTLIAGGTTAHTALVHHAKVQPGERVLVRGAAGGVGSVAVQLAKSLGATVTALASASSSEFVRNLGADAVIDYRATSPAQLGAFDIVFDAHGSSLFSFRRLLAPGGRMVSIAVDADAPMRGLLAIAASGVFGSRRIRFFRGNPGRLDLELLTTRVERGELRPVLDRTFSLSRAAEAHTALEARGVQGKLVITTSA
ncbi:NAD(P)-dependent alcohol dehydrogenase [Pseudoclavibacter sp. VKM Ac-2867]|uniref:NAD(P)-dependent alcohol dehydrogenase n=1 Tax=Pseudoclavibacter sp. VKM Ac-2867 TaxID=2783829 RepID=UPI00188CB2C7|nr:NAD(P)-dependent alcohol dehydrogenase [Pseudoclavibacter sp. VKM Ac-2867]MBF4457943.1 NAD(P)-dependent alcohol dehydrogenase [Pseudoclavibacter sp. VKM Ac-2867]